MADLNASTLVVVIPVLCGCLVSQTSGQVADGGAAARERVVLTDRAREIHSRTLLIDGHNDLPWEVRRKGESSFERIDISQPQPSLHTDIPRLREGNVGGQFWSVYVPASTAYNNTALIQVTEQIDLVKRMIRRYPETFELALTVDDIERVHKSGKIASLIGVEGGHAIHDSLAVLRRLYDLGARYMTLTHSDTLGWADSATDDPKHEGLTPFGEAVVREMNDLGMLVDLSHVSAATMHDALDVSRAPVIFSHSSARAVADHPRNVPDDVLERMKENGGVVMVNFYSGFIIPDGAKRSLDRFYVKRELEKKHSGDQDEVDRELARWEKENPIERGTIHDVIDHIDRIVKVAGIDHVGLGGDFDGVDVLPEQLEDVSKYPLITQELLNRGYDEESIHKIMGGNLLRAMRGAEEAAQP